jgi:hypothetical protein
MPAEVYEVDGETLGLPVWLQNMSVLTMCVLGWMDGDLPSALEVQRELGRIQREAPSRYHEFEKAKRRMSYARSNESLVRIPERFRAGRRGLGFLGFVPGDSCRVRRCLTDAKGDKLEAYDFSDADEELWQHVPIWSLKAAASDQLCCFGHLPNVSGFYQVSDKGRVRCVVDTPRDAPGRLWTSGSTLTVDCTLPQRHSCQFSTHSACTHPQECGSHQKKRERHHEYAVSNMHKAAELACLWD